MLRTVWVEKETYSRGSDKNRSRANRVHFSDVGFVPLCHTLNGKRITVSHIKEDVTCKRCLHYLSVGVTPDQRSQMAEPLPIQMVFYELFE